MNFQDLNQCLSAWGREGTLWRYHPVIVGGRLLGFQQEDGGLSSFTGDQVEARRLLRLYNYFVSNFWAKQLDQSGDVPKTRQPVRLREEFRRSPVNRPIREEELAEYKELLRNLDPGKVGEITYMENRERVKTALTRAAHEVNVRLRYLPGTKGVIHVTVAPPDGGARADV